MKETELYPPLKTYLEAMGYTVHAEVNGVDVMARRESELVIVEMKTAFNLQLVYQLIERLKITEHVYAFIPLGPGGRWPKSYKRMCGLLKRLHCGLLTLDNKTRSTVTLEFTPAPFQRRKNYARRKQLLREADGRILDLNQAGCTKEILFTAYKEKALRVALFLLENGASSPAAVREALDIESAGEILLRNHMRWFERIRRGVYTVTPEFEFFRLRHAGRIRQLWRD
jgi:hypothetical protein